MSNLSRILTPRFPNDVARVRLEIPNFLRLSDKEVELLWEAFSDERAAQWMFVDAETLKEFKQWLED